MAGCYPPVPLSEYLYKFPTLGLHVQLRVWLLQKHTAGTFMALMA